MATIYDVAKEAGTSISTVSHYLNKTKYVGPDKSKKIQEAIESLGYVPSRAAKSLKTKTSTEIHVVLPRLSDPQFSKTYEGISSIMADSGYVLVLHLTDDVVATENTVLNKIHKSNPAGLLICSCQPVMSELLVQIEAATPVIFLHREPAADQVISSVVFDNEPFIFTLARNIGLKGYSDLALLTGPSDLSSEKSAADGFNESHNGHDVLSLPFHKEEAFRQLALHYADKTMPECILSTSSLLTEAISELYRLREINDRLTITFGSDTWYSHPADSKDYLTDRSCEALGSYAGQHIIDRIARPKATEKKCHVIRDSFDCNSLQHPSRLKSTAPPTHITAHEPLRLLLLEDSTTVRAFQSIRTGFESRYEIAVELETITYDKLYEKLMANDHSETNYDLCSVDMPWLADMAHHDRITPLSDYMDTSPFKEDNGIYENPYRLGLAENRLYGIPYLIGLQMLFYRRDLFADRQMREGFFSDTGLELAPPENWFSYNQICRFFTKEFNPESPTSYGTCLADYFKSSILGEILPRIWAYDGAVIDKANTPLLCTPQVKKAFENYLEAADYGTKKAQHLAEDVAKFFSQGDVAMITSYMSYAPLIYDRMNSKVSGMVEFAPMPSDSSMVSGWSLCINRDSRQKEKAARFLEWFLSANISYHYSLISGSPTKPNLYQNPSLLRLYPWLSHAYDTFERGHTRRLISDTLRIEGIRDTLESMIAGIIYRRQSSRASLHSLLKQADRDLMKLLK